jgi:hypothetical protein
MPKRNIFLITAIAGLAAVVIMFLVFSVGINVMVVNEGKVTPPPESTPSNPVMDSGQEPAALPLESTPTDLEYGLLNLGIAGFLIYWLSLPLWVWLDHRSQVNSDKRKSVLWGLFVLVTNLAGLLAYLLTKKTA